LHFDRVVLLHLRVQATLEVVDLPALLLDDRLLRLRVRARARVRVRWSVCVPSSSMITVTVAGG